MLPAERIVIVSFNNCTAAVGYRSGAAQMVGEVIKRVVCTSGIVYSSNTIVNALQCSCGAAPAVNQRTCVIIAIVIVINYAALGAICQPVIRCNCCTALAERLLQVKNIICDCQIWSQWSGQIKNRTQVDES